MLPPKPQHFAIFPGRSYLKRSPPLGSESSLSTGSPEAQLMTATDKSKAEMKAWVRILASLASRYDTSAWGADPPIPLEDMWEMLASAYYRLMELGTHGTERNDLAMVPFAWLKSVSADLGRCADPSDDGLNFIGSDGSIIRPRTNIIAPAVASFDVTLFPGNDDELVAGVALGGSIEEFQKRHGSRSQTYGIASPVPM